MKKLLFSFLNVLLISSTSFAQVYFDQITGYSNAGGKSAQVFPDVAMCALQTADDFTVPSGTVWNIDSVFTVGTMNVGSFFDSVIVSFYYDNSGQPGTIHSTDTVTLPTTQFASTLEIVLNQTITLSPGTYWITINVIMDFNGGLAPGGQWFQGSFGTTAIGNEWHFKDSCDLLVTGNTAWQSSTSLLGGTKDLMFKLVSGTPCTTISDLNTTVTGSTIFSSQTNVEYQWIDCSNGNAIMTNDTNQSFTAQVNGDYACIIYNGCALDTTNCVTISCIEALDNTVTIGFENVTCNDSTADSYQWLDCDDSFSIIPGETSKTFSPAVSGNYSCEIMKGCSIDSTICSMIIISGINNLESNLNISVYPNPTKGLLTIEKGNLIVNEINVLNLTGVLMITTMINNDHINVSELPTGVYILEIKTNDGIGYSKFVKK